MNRKRGTQSIVIIAAGTGNIRSIQKAFAAAGSQTTVSNEPEEILAADKLVLPGVGAFGDFMRGLQQRNCLEPIQEFFESGRPMLGICVGMQALFDYGLEFGRQPGLGLIAGSVQRFPSQANLKIPQTGWNQIEIRPNSSLFRGINDGAFVYFNHTFYCLPADSTVAAAWTDYGIRYCSSLEYQNIFGVQFHPEKSQSIGLKLLSNFILL